MLIRNMAAGSLMILMAACSPDRAVVVHEPTREDNPDYRELLERTRERQKATEPVEQIREAILRFQMDQGRTPEELRELVQTGYLEQIPNPPDGAMYEYNSTLGIVELVNRGAAGRAARDEEAGIRAPSLMETDLTAPMPDRELGGL